MSLFSNCNVQFLKLTMMNRIRLCELQSWSMPSYIASVQLCTCPCNTWNSVLQGAHILPKFHCLAPTLCWLGIFLWLRAYFRSLSCVHTCVHWWRSWRSSVRLSVWSVCVCVCGVVNFIIIENKPQHTWLGFGMKSTAPRRSELWRHDAGERGCKTTTKKASRLRRTLIQYEEYKAQYNEETASR